MQDHARSHASRAFSGSDLKRSAAPNPAMFRRGRTDKSGSTSRHCSPGRRSATGRDGKLVRGIVGELFLTEPNTRTSATTRRRSPRAIMKNEFEGETGERYFRMMRERPELFDNSNSGGIEVLTERDEIRAAQDSA